MSVGTTPKNLKRVRARAQVQANMDKKPYVILIEKGTARYPYDMYVMEDKEYADKMKSRYVEVIQPGGKEKLGLRKIMQAEYKMVKYILKDKIKEAQEQEKKLARLRGEE